MGARDANDATWYVLRYERDFVPRPAAPPHAWQSPALSPELFYDPDRHVLELQPQPLPLGDLPPGVAVDVHGNVYRSEPARRTVMKRCCDGSEAPLVCEPGVFARPAGLALDGRGLLYAADPVARRVVVVHAGDGSIAGVLAGGLQEPVDVAAAPDGTAWVADRAAGLVVRFGPRFERCGEFVPRARGADAAPVPFAIALDADAAVVVFDAALPRPLRFGADGRPRATGVHDAACRPCQTGTTCRAGGTAALDARLAWLRAHQRFHACGTFVSVALDGGRPGTTWHRIEIDGEVPAGTWLKIQAATSDDPDGFDDPDPATAPAFHPAEDSDCAAPPRVSSDVPDRLVQAPPGRYLRLRLTLGSDGARTPTIRAIRVFHPRVSYLDLLPRVYREEPESASFLGRFLALFERVFTGVEDRYELFTRQLDPDAAPLEVIDWLADLVDLAFDPSWPAARRRALVAAAMELYRRRGTPAGLARYVEIYTGVRPVILEGFLDRPARPPLLGVEGGVLGATSRLSRPGHAGSPEEALVQGSAHRFTVLVPLPDACDEHVLLPVVDHIVARNKPAHTVHAVEGVRPGAEVGVARVGLGPSAGAPDRPGTIVGGCAQPGAPPPPPAVLGTDSILGSRGPADRRPPGLALS